MSRARSLTPLQLADAVARERDGRPDLASMSREERRAAGLMTIREGAEHERLAVVPYQRAAERSKGPVPGDIWASDDASDRAGGLMWEAWAKAGHGNCAGWSWSLLDDGILCTCGGIVPLPEGLVAS